MKCPNCVSDLSDGAKLCQVCGARIQQDQSPATAASQAQTSTAPASTAPAVTTASADATYVGTYTGDLVVTMGYSGAKSCYGVRQHPVKRQIKSVDTKGGMMKVAASVLYHGHKMGDFANGAARDTYKVGKA